MARGKRGRKCRGRVESRSKLYPCLVVASESLDDHACVHSRIVSPSLLGARSSCEESSSTRGA
jgi:hypothetical protein